MSNAVFPVLPGLKWGVPLIPNFRTKIQEAVSGKELRGSFMAYPNWDIHLSYELLRNDGAAELKTLGGFFLQRRGAWDDFLYDNPDDNSVTDYQFGTGDGATKDFQLTRAFGAGGVTFVEPVQNVNGSPSIYKGGVLQSAPTHYSLGATGIVSFVTAPANGVALTWTGAYYYRCRFKQDLAEFSKFMKDLWELKKLELRSVKI